MTEQSSITNPTKTRQEEINESMNSLIGHTTPRVFSFPTSDELRQLCSMIEGVTGKPISAATAPIFEYWFEKVEFELLIEAARRTGLYARRPSVNYWNAILKNWVKQDIRTKADLTREADARSHDEAQSGSKWWTNSFNYHQREYKAEDFKDFFFDPFKEAAT